MAISSLSPQALSLPIICGGVGYLLVHYPGYFAGVIFGLFGIMFTPVGRWLVRPHAQKGIEIGRNITKNLISNAIDGSVGQFIQQEDTIVSFEKKVQEIIVSAMDKAVKQVNTSVDSVTEITTQAMSDLTKQVFDQEDLINGLGEKVTTALKGVFQGEFFADMRDTLDVIGDNNDWHEPLMKKMKEAALFVVTDLKVKQSMGVAAESQVKAYLNDAAFKGEFLKMVERVAHEFRDAMQVAGSGLLR